MLSHFIFPLVFHYSYVSILRRVRDVASYLLKVAKFSYCWRINVFIKRDTHTGVLRRVPALTALLRWGLTQAASSRLRSHFLAFSFWPDAAILIKFATSSIVEEPHDMVSSTVDCASASKDNKITGRQITANTTAKQHDLDMLTAVQPRMFYRLCQSAGSVFWYSYRGTAIEATQLGLTGYGWKYDSRSLDKASYCQ